jgi:hypothetical protein
VDVTKKQNFVPARNQRSVNNALEKNKKKQNSLLLGPDLNPGSPEKETCAKPGQLISEKLRGGSRTQIAKFTL